MSHLQYNTSAGINFWIYEILNELYCTLASLVRLLAAIFTTLVWWLVRVALVVVFGLLPQIFGRWRGPTNSILSLYQYRLSGGDTQMWWGHSNPTGCNQIHLNFFSTQEAVGMLQLLAPGHSHPSYVPMSQLVSFAT